MAEHERISHKNQDDVDQKHNQGQKNSQSLSDHFHAWDENNILIGETPFKPQLERHIALMTKARLDEQRANIVMHLQRYYGNAYVQRVIEHIQTHRSRGNILEPRVYSQMETTMAQNQGDAQIHTGAEALTTDKDIFFSNGAYNHNSEVGKKPLSRELTHLVQQTTQTKVSAPYKTSEKETERIIDGAVSNTDVPIHQGMLAKSVAPKMREPKIETHGELKTGTTAEIEPPKKSEMVITEEEVEAYVTWKDWLNTKAGKEYQSLRDQLIDKKYQFIIKIQAKSGAWEETTKEPDDYEDIRQVGWSIGRKKEWHWARHYNIGDLCRALLLPPLELASIERAYLYIKGSPVGEHISELAAKAVEETAKFYLVDEVEFQIQYKKLTGQDAPSNMAAFCNPYLGVAYICSGRAQASAVFHEALHMYANTKGKGTLLAECGDQVEEGVCSYFTREICIFHNIPFTTGHEDELYEVDGLASLVGQKLLQAAYFEGDVDRLRTKVDDILNGEGKFQQWVTYMRAGDYPEARKVLYL